MNKILVVIDMQNDFITGPLGTPEAVAIVPKVKEKIEEYRSRRDQIIFTMDTHYEETYLNTHEGKLLPVKHCINETKGWMFADELPLEPFEHVVIKNQFGYGYWGHHIWEEAVHEIEIIGVCTDICVISNALIIRSQMPNIDITVDASCCAGTTPENHKAALQVMKSCQINVINE